MSIWRREWSKVLKNPERPSNSSTNKHSLNLCMLVSNSKSIENQNVKLDIRHQPRRWTDLRELIW